MLLQYVFHNFGDSLARLNLNSLRCTDKDHSRLQILRHSLNKLARHMRGACEQDKLRIIKCRAQVTGCLYALRYLVCCQINIIDAKTIDAFNHIAVARPEADLLASAPGNDSQRRPPTPCAYYRNAAHAIESRSRSENRSQEPEARSQNDKAEATFTDFLFFQILASDFWLL